MDEIPITIIGAGVIGLAIAAQLSPQHDIILLEKNEHKGMETSSRNSEVIHSGIYYPQGSFKAQLCVEGNRMLYGLCAQYGIEHKNTQKLVVAVSEEEVPELERLAHNGRANGVQGLEIIDSQRVRELEPLVRAHAALLCKTSGIIDVHGLMHLLEVRAREHGAIIAYHTSVVSIQKKEQGYIIGTRNASGAQESFRSRVVINSAGLHAHKVAAMVGLDAHACGYDLHYCKGEYFSVRGSHAITRLIYPVPEKKLLSLGIHATLDLAGQLRLGPSAQYVDAIDYTVDERNAGRFHQSAQRYLPWLALADLQPAYAGVRPKLQGPGEEHRDFVIAHEASRGLAGFFNLIGMDSPGLTASPAIAQHVGREVRNYLL